MGIFTWSLSGALEVSSSVAADESAGEEVDRPGTVADPDHVEEQREATKG